MFRLRGSTTRPIHARGGGRLATIPFGKGALTLVFAAFAAFAALGLYGTVYAHALPVKTAPADGAVVNVAPSQVAMDTAEEMTGKASENALVVYDSNSNIITGDAKVDSTRQHMSVSLPSSLKAGLYIVRWFTVADEDGESASGSWSFSFDPALAAKAGEQPKVTNAMAMSDGGIPAWTLAVAAVGGVVVGFGAALIVSRNRRAGAA